MSGPVWTKEDSEAAQTEQWDIWDCTGSDNGQWQLCRIDFPEKDGASVPNLWNEDVEVWLHVVQAASGDANSPHYRALQFLEFHNPDEINAIERHVKKHGYSAIPS
jgi:hypothetical protein